MPPSEYRCTFWWRDRSFVTRPASGLCRAVQMRQRGK
jgi:hypothetical protein